jgi:hypothetical protein
MLDLDSAMAASHLEKFKARAVFQASALKISAERPNLKVLPVDLPDCPSACRIMTLTGRTLDPVSQLFIKTAREIARRLKKEE